MVLVFNANILCGFLYQELPQNTYIDIGSVYNIELGIGANRNYLKGINLIGLRRYKYDNKSIMELNEAYKKIFSSKNLHENLSKINGEFKENKLVQEVTSFISSDKNRPICSPQEK